MSLASQTTPRDRVTHMLWIGNAVVGIFFALLGGLISSETFGYNLHVSVFGMPAGTLLATSGISLFICAVWRIRPARLTPAPATIAVRRNS